MNEDIVFQVLEAVNEIPKGKVATYKQIACLIGKENNCRLVGKILSRASYYGNYPWYRVVNSLGRCAPPCFLIQRRLLENEGITFKKNGCVDMKKYQWNKK